MRLNIVNESDDALGRYLRKAQRYGHDAVLEVLHAWKNAENDPEYPKGDAEKESAYQLSKVKELLDKKKQILIVDDDESVRNLTASILSRDGYANISQAGNSKEALEYLLRNRPDLVISDNNMPRDNNGLDIYIFIMKNPSYADTTEFILMTGNTRLLDELPQDSNYRKFLNDRPLRHILYKPYQIDELKRTVEDCLRE